MATMDPGELKLTQRGSPQSRGKADVDLPRTLVLLPHATLASLSLAQRSELAGRLNVTNAYLSELLADRSDGVANLPSAKPWINAFNLQARTRPSVWRWLLAALLVPVTWYAFVGVMLGLFYPIVELAILIPIATIGLAARIAPWPYYQWSSAQKRNRSQLANPAISHLRITLATADLADVIASDLRELLDELEQKDELTDEQLNAELQTIGSLIQADRQADPTKNTTLQHSTAALKATQHELS